MLDAAWISWRNAATGGALIGLASGGLMLFNGRIAGISGIFHRAVEGSREGWRWAFLLGLVASGLGMRTFVAAEIIASNPTLYSYLTAIAAGLLVGFGTRMGSGCTSGHGICGQARLSLRSLVAVLVFLASGIAVTAVMRLTGTL
ncbi:MAG: YeeE/YedE family protein [Betaproteobacteria bacterium]